MKAVIIGGENLLVSKTAILNRFLKINGFSDLDEAQKNRITDAFIKGSYDWSSRITNCSGTTFIRAKGRGLNIEEYTDNDLIFWGCRILELPYMIINFNKNG